MVETEHMPLALRWWQTLQPRERIVAMSLLTGGVIAIVNSAVWAIAVCYMNHERIRASLTRAQHDDAQQDEPPQPVTFSATASASARLPQRHRPDKRTTNS